MFVSFCVQSEQQQQLQGFPTFSLEYRELLAKVLGRSKGQRWKDATWIAITTGRCQPLRLEEQKGEGCCPHPRSTTAATAVVEANARSPTDGSGCWMLQSHLCWQTCRCCRSCSPSSAGMGCHCYCPSQSRRRKTKAPRSSCFLMRESVLRSIQASSPCGTERRMVWSGDNK